ncbi:hypothetical protein PFISCL1PPCAC_24383, partial [Pristionchus fissidentatus]
RDELPTEFTVRLPKQLFYDTEGIEYNVADPKNRIVRETPLSTPRCIQVDPQAFGFPDPQMMSNCVVWKRRALFFCGGHLWTLWLDDFNWNCDHVQDHQGNVWESSNGDDFVTFVDEERGFVELIRVRPSLEKVEKITATTIWLDAKPHFDIDRFTSLKDRVNTVMDK